MLADQHLHGLGEVVPEICHLHGLGGSGAAAVREGATPVAADDLHSGVLGEPGGEGGRLPVREKIDRGVCLAIDQHRPVVVSLAGGELVNPQYPGRPGGRIRQGHGQSQQRGPADRRRQPGRQPLAGPTRQSHRDRTQQVPELRGSTPIAHGQPLDLLGEGHPVALRRIAKQTADGQRDGHPPTADRAICKTALVPAVPSDRRCLAVRARRRNRPRVLATMRNIPPSTLTSSTSTLPRCGNTVFSSSSHSASVAAGVTERHRRTGACPASRKS